MSEPARPPNTAGISVTHQRLPFSTHWTLLWAPVYSMSAYGVGIVSLLAAIGP